MEDDRENNALNLCAVFFCILCAALGAGLTMGLMSIEKTKLEIIQMTGSPSDADAAKTLIPIIGNHHLLLVTLLLFNAVANEAMPVFLEKLVPPYLAVLLSVSLVLIFGEILPSALFTGKRQITLAAKLSSFVWFLLYMLYPITLPISKLLDCVFGHSNEGAISRDELEAFVILQNAACRAEYKRSDTSVNVQPSELSRDEVGIMTGVLRLSQLTARDAMIPIDKVSMISSNVVLDESSLERIMAAGFSRFPVFQEQDRGFLLGYLLVKKLIVVNPADKKPITGIELLEPIVVHPNEDLLEMLNIFQDGKSHLALVSNDPEATLGCIQDRVAPVSEESSVLGIVTLENIIEKIIQEEIHDESDHLRASSSYSQALTSLSGPGSFRPYTRSGWVTPSASGPETAPLLTRVSSAPSPRKRRKQSLSVRPLLPLEEKRDLLQPSSQRIQRCTVNTAIFYGIQCRLSTTKIVMEFGTNSCSGTTVQYRSRNYGDDIEAAPVAARRKAALEDMCRASLYHGAFLRGQVGYRVDPVTGDVTCIANKFIPADTRLMYIPMSTAFTSTLLGEWHGMKRVENEGKCCGGFNDTKISNEDMKIPPWAAELRQVLSNFERTFQHTPHAAHSFLQSSQSPPLIPTVPNDSDDFFKKPVSGDQLELVLSLLGSLRRYQATKNQAGAAGGTDALRLELLNLYWASLPSLDHPDSPLAWPALEQDLLMRSTSLCRGLTESKRYLQALYRGVVVPFMSGEDYHFLFSACGDDDGMRSIGPGFETTTVAEALAAGVAAGAWEEDRDSDGECHYPLPTLVLSPQQLARRVINFASFERLCFLVTSRTFACMEKTDGASNGSGVMMLPFVDLCNGTCIEGHENAVLETLNVEEDVDTRGSCVNKSMYALRATQHITAGTELLLLYRSSSTSNADYLLNYGYLPLYCQSQHKTSQTKSTRDLVSVVKKTQDVVYNSHNYVELMLHQFIVKLLHIVHPRGEGPGGGESGELLRAAKWRHIVEVEQMPAVLRVSRELLVTAHPQVMPIASRICRLIHLLLCDQITFRHVTSGEVLFPRLDRVVSKRSTRACSSAGDICRDAEGKFDKFVVINAFRLLVDMHMDPLHTSGKNIDLGSSELRMTHLLPWELSEACLLFIEHKLPHYSSLMLMFMSEIAVWDTLIQQFVTLPLVTHQQEDLEERGWRLVWRPYLSLRGGRSVMSLVEALVLQERGRCACVCDWCGASGDTGDITLSRCTSCLSAHYCGPECQKGHWLYHKKLCKEIKKQLCSMKLAE